ncbi:MAG: hypothetical protein IKM11_00340 [Oscillospiraceae bacterium]|nr:hypothetical protein [Oscillospiraceae bacterium]
MNENIENRKPIGLKKKVLTVAIALAAVAVLAVTGASILLASPLALVGTGAANSIAALEKSDAAVFFEKFGESGSMELTVGLEELMDSALGFGVDAEAVVKLYRDGDDGAAVTADVKLGGETFVDAALTANQTELAITSAALLGDKAYGVDLTKASEHFENSVFGPNGEYSLGIDSLDSMTENAVQGEQMDEDAQKIGESFFGVLMNSLNEYAQTGKEKKELDFNGEKIRTTAVDVALDSEALANVAGDMVEYLYTNKELEQFLRTYSAQIVDVLVYLDAVFYDDPEEFVDDFYESLEEIYTDLDDFKEEIADSDVVLDAVFYVTKSGKELIGFDLTVECDGEEMELSVLAGPSISDLREVKVKLDDGQSFIRVNYSVEINDKTDYAAKFSVREDDAELASGNIVWDKTCGAYAITVFDEYDEALSIEGKFERNAQSVALTLEKITSGYGYEEMVIDLSVQINVSDKMPPMPQQYTDVLTMTANEIEDLTEELAAELMSAVYRLDPDILGELSQMLWMLG